MKATPTNDEAAAIAAAVLRYAALRPEAHASTESPWREVARREAVLSIVPPTWRA